jgi:hypothetical protein
MQHEECRMKKAELKTGPAALPLSVGHSAFARLHRDERGGMVDYAMIIGAIGIPLFVLLEYMLEVLSDYFGLIAYYVTWPFL